MLGLRRLPWDNGSIRAAVAIEALSCPSWLSGSSSLSTFDFGFNDFPDDTTKKGASSASKRILLGFLFLLLSFLLQSGVGQGALALVGKDFDNSFLCSLAAFLTAPFFGGIFSLTPILRLPLSWQIVDLSLASEVALSSSVVPIFVLHPRQTWYPFAS